MSNSTDDELSRQLRAISSWGDPGEVPAPEMLAAPFPSVVSAPAPKASRRWWWALSTAAAVIVVVVGVWAVNGRSDPRVVTDDPRGSNGPQPDGGSFPWLLPPADASLSLSVLRMPADGSPSPAASTALFAAKGLSSADLSVGRRSSAIPALELRDGRAYLAGSVAPLPASTASVIDTPNFGPVLIVCGAAVQAAADDANAGGAAGSTSGPMSAMWELDGHDVTLTSDTTQIENPRPGCDATGPEAASLESTIRDIRQVPEATWRATFEQQNVTVRAVPANS